MGQLRPDFPNASHDLTVQQAVDVGAVGRACIPPQESLFSLLWLTEPFTGTLLNHRMVPLTPEQTQALKRRHGKADAPKACPPPLRHAGCSAPGLQNQGRAHCWGSGQNIAPPRWQMDLCSAVFSLLNCSEEWGQPHRLPEVPGNGTLLFCLCESKQHHACESPARRFPEWMCGAPLCALCIYRYSLLYFLRSLTNALNECLSWGSSVCLGMIGYVAFCSFHKFQT